MSTYHHFPTGSLKALAMAGRRTRGPVCTLVACVVGLASIMASRSVQADIFDQAPRLKMTSAMASLAARTDEAVTSVASVPEAAGASVWGRILDSYVARAAATHPASARARADVGAASAALNSAQWQLAPTPSFVRGFDGSINAYTNVFRLEQPVWTGGRITAGIDSARATVTSSEGTLLDAERTLALKVAQTWGDWAKSLRLLEALKDLESEHQELLGLIERRRAQGVATVSDVELSKVRLSSVRSEQGQAGANAEYQRGLLASASGGEVDPASTHDLDGVSPAAPSVDELMATIDSAPMVRKVQADVHAAEAALEAQKAAMHPQVFLRYEKQWGAMHADKVSIAVQTSFGPGLSTVSDLDARRAKVDAARLAVSAVRKDLHEQYMQEFTRMDAARQRVTDARAAVESGRAVLASYRRQFDVGRRSWLELLGMVREVHQLRVEATNAQLDYSVALYRILLLLRPVEPAGVREQTSFDRLLSSIHSAGKPAGGRETAP